MATLFCMKWRYVSHLESVTSSPKIRLPPSMCIYVKNVPAKFHPNQIWNDGALGFFVKWRHSCHLESMASYQKCGASGFLKTVAPTTRTTTWVAIWDQFLIQKWWGRLYLTYSFYHVYVNVNGTYYSSENWYTPLYILGKHCHLSRSITRHFVQKLKSFCAYFIYTVVTVNPLISYCVTQWYGDTLGKSGLGCLDYWYCHDITYSEKLDLKRPFITYLLSCFSVQQPVGFKAYK